MPARRPVLFNELVAVLNQRLQLLLEFRQQSGSRFGRQTLRVELQRQYQRSLANNTDEVEFVGTIQLVRDGFASVLVREFKQSVISACMIEFAQIVKTDPWVGSERLPRHISQYAITRTLVRNAPQILFHTQDLGADIAACDRKEERVEAGKPAHGAGQVQRIVGQLPTVSFERNQRSRRARPFFQCSAECR